MNNTNLAAICLKKSDTIRDAIRKMAQNKPQRTHIPAGIVLVTDAARKLLGIATDGDVRRALSTGAGLDSPISGVMNKNPFLIVGQHSGEEILALVADKIRREGWHKDRLDKIVVVDRNKKPS